MSKNAHGRKSRGWEVAPNSGMLVSLVPGIPQTEFYICKNLLDNKEITNKEIS